MTLAPAQHLLPTRGAEPLESFGVDGELVWLALAATRAAALAAWGWVGRGSPKQADAAATEAMRAVLGRGSASGVVVTGEGAKDKAPMLADGEVLGSGREDPAGECAGGGEPSGLRASASYDIAVDPLECTDLCAAGLPGAMSTIALAPRGSLWRPGPAFYMEKLVLGPRAAGAISLGASPEEIVSALRARLGVQRPRVVVLDKPRHRELIARLRAAGASVLTPSAGDVAGALAVVLPDGGADALVGIGGTPEGVLAACAVRALGGFMQGRLAPQREDERAALEREGVSLRRVLELSELVACSRAAFIATGVTGGLLRAPREREGWLLTDSLLIAGGAVRRINHSTPIQE